MNETPEIPTEAPIEEKKSGSIGLGIGLCALLHLFQVLLLPVAGPFWIGISQLVYVVPAVLIARKKGQVETAKGLWIGAGITFLINIACFGVVMASIGKNGFH